MYAIRSYYDNKFAEMHVRDLKGYNERIKEEPYCTDEKYHKLPQIVSYNFV